MSRGGGSGFRFQGSVEDGVGAGCEVLRSAVVVIFLALNILI